MLTCRILGGRSFSTASFVRRRMKGITCIMADNSFDIWWTSSALVEYNIQVVPAANTRRLDPVGLGIPT